MLTPYIFSEAGLDFQSKKSKSLDFFVSFCVKTKKKGGNNNYSKIETFG